MTQQQLTMQTAQLGEMLTLEQQFRHDLSSRPRLDAEQERLLIERVRSGDTAARDELILSLIPQLKAFVHRFLSNNYEDVFPRFEFLDLVQEGVKAMLEAFDRMRTDADAGNPHGFLLSSAYGVIRKYCHTHRSLISVPHTPGVRPFAMENLDSPLFNDETETVADLIAAPEMPSTKCARDFTLLYQAIEQLTPKRKTVVIRRYGLYDHAPSLLRDLSQSFYGNSDHTAACHQFEVAALSALRSQLQTAYPQYGTDSLKPRKQYAYDCLTLSDARCKQLEEAEARIRARGEQVTVVGLGREARMGKSWAGRYLHERQDGASENAGERRDNRLAQAYARLQERGERISSMKLAAEAGMKYQSAVHTFLRQQRVTQC